MKVEFEISKAKEIAQKNLDSLQAARNRELEWHINKVQKRREKWRKIFFFLKPLSRDQAISILKNDRYIVSTYCGIMHILYGEKELVCKKILKACELTSANTVTLDSDDLYYLNINAKI